MRPNFSMVRLKNQPFKKKQKKTCGSTTDTHIRLMSWSKPIRDSEGRTPLIGCGPDIPVHVCKFENACAAAVRQRER